MRLGRVSVLLCLLLVLSWGCNKSGAKLVPVSGRVKLDGVPLANATITFQLIDKSASGSAPDAIGTTYDDGRFTLKSLVGLESYDGAVAGKHRVRIFLLDRTATTKDTEGRVKVGVSKVPAKYNNNSTLEFVVPAEGTDKADFLDLTTKK
jgi:hypothetical protein